MVVLDAATGAVRVMVGGRDYRDSNFNRAVNAHRQPGSAFKPFIWLMALENGMTPTDTVLDAPIRIGNWQPEDFEREYRGEITLDEALAHSVNTVVGPPDATFRRSQSRPPRRRDDWASTARCRTTRRWRWAPGRSGCWN